MATVLILTVTTGFGHHATAKAVADELERRGAITQTVDVYKYVSRLMYETIDKGYLFSSKYIPEVYRTIYDTLERKDKPYSPYAPLSVIQFLCSLKFEKFIEDFAPDMIVCTHIFATQMLNELKLRNKINVPVVGIITDYTIHPYWEDVQNIEYIVTASEMLTHKAIKRGIAPEAIVPLGIPIKPQFSSKISKAEARKQLNVPENVPVILVMGGSMGYGKMVTAVRKIRDFNKDYYVIAVCGNNKNLFRKMYKLNGDCEISENMHVYGFTDQVSVMMDAADCIVTKPGGITVSEALAKNLPMILISPIPGQEERNIEFLLNNGAALYVTKTFDIDEALYYMFNGGTHLNLMEQSINAIRKPNSTSDLAEFILNKIEQRKEQKDLIKSEVGA